MIAGLALAAALIPAAFAMARLLLGPGLLDRAVAAQALGVLGGCAAAAAALAGGGPGAVDLALAALVVQLVLAVALLKSARRRSLQPPLAGLEARPRPAPATLAAGEGGP